MTECDTKPDCLDSVTDVVVSSHGITHLPTLNSHCFHDIVLHGVVLYTYNYITNISVGAI